MMGYETQFRIQVSPDYGPLSQFGASAVIAALRANNDTAFFAIDADGEPSNSAKWYEWERELRDFSTAYPSKLFTVDGEGEEQGDVWRAYIQDGKSVVHRPEAWTPPAFDPSALR